MEKLHEAGLRAGCAAAAEEPDGCDHVVQLFEVEHQVLKPERRALADGDELRGLIVRVAEAGQGGIAVGKAGQLYHDLLQFAAQMDESVAVEHKVGVVGDITARRAEVDDALRAGRSRAEGIDVRHHIVPQLLFLRRDEFIVDGGDVCGQLVHLLLRHGQAQRVLRLRQRYPEPPPRLKPYVRGE